MTDLNTIRDAFAARGALNVELIFLDSEYSCPTRRAIDGIFSEALRARILGLGLVWKANKSDCNTFSLEAMSHARQCHLQGDEGGQLAFGMLLYHSRNMGYHAVNVYIEFDGGKPVARAYEPQFQRTVELTDEEWKSCTHAFF